MPKYPCSKKINLLSNNTSRFFDKKVTYITKGYTQPEDKFNAISRWIIAHKKFDVKGFKKFRLEAYSLEESVKRKKLLSNEYSQLLSAMCQQAGISCSSVDGYSKYAWHYPYKRFYYCDYSWNTVNLNDRYFIADIAGASGFLIQKNTWGESIKTMLHIPCVPSKLKFKKIVDPAKLNISAEEAMYKLISIVPMWQLMDKPYSIEEFEMEAYEMSKDSSQEILYKNLIANYEGKDKADRFLILAEEGQVFNSKNNLNSGLNYLAYSNQKYRLLKESGWSSENDLKVKSKELLGYTNKASTLLDRFLNDNKSIHKKCLDSLSKKTKEINDFNSKNKKEAQATIRSLTKKEYTNEKVIVKNEGLITKKEIEQQARANQKVILAIRKSLSNKTSTDSIDYWMDMVQRNIEKIQTGGALFSVIDSAIILFEKDRMILWDSVQQIFNLKLLCIAKACDENLKHGNISILRIYHQNYVNYHSSQLELEKTLNDLERQYKNQLLKQIDSLNRFITKTANLNKRLLFKIKRFSPAENYTLIDSLYERQNDYAEDCHKRSIDNVQRWNLYLKLWNIEYEARKNVSKYMIKFSDKYSKVESISYKRYLAIEQLRFKKFHTYGERMRNQCEVLKTNINQLSKSTSIQKK